jgi:peptidase M23-like protein
MRIKQFISLIFVLFASIAISFAQEEIPETSSEANSASPAIRVEGDGIILDVYFRNLKQGRAALLGLRGDNITSADISVFNRRNDFFQIPEVEGWWAIFSAGMEQSIRQYDLRVTVNLENEDEAQVLLLRFNVTNGRFLRQPVTLPEDPRLLALLEPEVEETEFAQIFDIATIATEEVLWGRTGFGAALGMELSSPFGAARVFNETLNTVHTGWDFNAEMGLPLVAAASGRVAFAGEMAIRGNYVLVNHGRGAYTGYAHMSVIFVTQGQMVQRGQVIGLVGSTGRSSGAHAHFEAIVEGNWVDPIDFVRLYMP